MKSQSCRPDDQPTIIIKEREPGGHDSQIRREAKRYGWRLLNVESSWDIIPRGIEPIGALLRGGMSDPTVQLVKEKQIPFVRVGSFLPYYAEGMSTVFLDMEECGRVAAKFFVDRGFSTLGFFGYEPWGDGELIYHRYRDTAVEMGCQCHLFQSRAAKKDDPDVSVRIERLQRQASDLGKWIRGLPRPIGLLCYSDTIASRICTFVLEAGLKVPEDVAILSIGDNSFLCETAPVPISSVALPWARMWKEGFAYLNGILQGEREELEHLYIPPRDVIERQSTEVIPVNDPLVAQGLEFIWDNYHWDICVQDMVDSLKVSRSTIQRSFNRYLNRGFNEELRRKRLEVAERLLLQSDLTVARVALKVGFNSRNYFHKAFVEMYGATPSDYRKKHKHSD